MRMVAPPLVYGVYYVAKWAAASSIQHTPVYKRDPTQFDRYPTAKVANHHNGQCVIDVQKQLYDRPKGSLRRQFHEQKQWGKYKNVVPLESFYNDYWNEHYKGEWDGKGVTMAMAYAWCVKYDVPCSFLDNGGKTILLNKGRGTCKERPLVGYFTDFHFYQIDDYAQLHRIAETGHNISRPVKSLPVPDFDMRRKAQTKYERKCMSEAQELLNETTGSICIKDIHWSKQLSMQVGITKIDEAARWDWSRAKHVILGNDTNEMLWDLITS